MSLEADSHRHIAPLSMTRGSLDVRMMSAMRLTLAGSALLILWFDPPKSVQFLPVTYASLFLYFLYSLIIYAASMHRPGVLPVRFLHWIDLAWYVLLISLSGGIDSVFFFFFFFAILAASFGRGFSWGLRVTIICTLLFTLLAYLIPPAQGKFEANRFLLRYVNLLVIGYMIAYWGGAEITLRERLSFLKEVSLLSNPRFGIEQTLQSIIEKLRAFYDAKSSVLVFSSDPKGSGSFRMYRVDLDETKQHKPIEMSQEVAATFLLPSPTEAVICRKRPGSKSVLYDVLAHRPIVGAPRSAVLLNAFEGESCLSVPVWDRSYLRGRLFVVGGKRRFDQTEIEFVLQVIEQVIPLLENIRLVDRLASDAARHERRKIGQDIHDSVIQPYIGLQFGLAAITQKLQNGNSDVRQEVHELLKMTEAEIKDLRRYVGGLRTGESTEGAFLPVVKQFAAKFSDATGLQVEINSPDDLPIYDRLAAELFQMIEEGLSNIRRHSSSSFARVDISRKNSHLILQLTNQRRKSLETVSFVPRSIAERAAALGGETLVYSDANNNTVVSVQIPL